MSKEINFLKERAQEFWKEAIRNIEEGNYNLAAFHLEQAMQLYLKYLIGKELGEWPKTHYLYELLSKINEIYKNEKLKKFQEENELFWDDLSDAYFTSRYYPRTFSKSLVENFKKYCEEFFKLVEEELNDRFER